MPNLPQGRGQPKGDSKMSINNHLTYQDTSPGIGKLGQCHEARSVCQREDGCLSLYFRSLTEMVFLLRVAGLVLKNSMRSFVI